MRWLALAALFGLAACSGSSPSASDGGADLAAPPDLSASVDLAGADLSGPDLAAVDFAGCGPACATADYTTTKIDPVCPTLLRGTVCNTGTVAGATDAVFYFTPGGGLPLPAFNRSQATPLCTVPVGPLPPGSCLPVSCSPSSELATGSYWLRADDDGTSYPRDVECCQIDDLEGTFIDCTLP